MTKPTQEKQPIELPSLPGQRPEYLLLALMQVLDENFLKINQMFDRRSSNDPAWFTNAELREDIWKRVRRWWSKITTEDFTLFPYSVDYVVRLYAIECNVKPESNRKRIKYLQSAIDKLQSAKTEKTDKHA